MLPGPGRPNPGRPNPGAPFTARSLRTRRRDDFGNDSPAGRVFAGVSCGETNGAAPRAARVLILARRTATGSPLLDAVARRAHRGPCNFTLLVPASHRPVHVVGERRAQRDLYAERLIAAAVPLLTRAARSEVVAVIGAYDPLAAVRDALNLLQFDEVIVSMLFAHASAWLRRGLPAQIRALGVPVTEVIGTDSPITPLSAA